MAVKRTTTDRWLLTKTECQKCNGGHFYTGNDHPAGPEFGFETIKCQTCDGRGWSWEEDTP